MRGCKRRGAVKKKRRRWWGRSCWLSAWLTPGLTGNNPASSAPGELPSGIEAESSTQESSELSKSEWNRFTSRTAENNSTACTGHCCKHCHSVPVVWGQMRQKQCKAAVFQSRPRYSRSPSFILSVLSVAIRLLEHSVTWLRWNLDSTDSKCYLGWLGKGGKGTV